MFCRHLNHCVAVSELRLDPMGLLLWLPGKEGFVVIGLAHRLLERKDEIGLV